MYNITSKIPKRMKEKRVWGEEDDRIIKRIENQPLYRTEKKRIKEKMR